MELIFLRTAGSTERGQARTGHPRGGRPLHLAEPYGVRGVVSRYRCGRRGEQLRLVQYGILGAATGVAINAIALHSLPESAVRPARVAIAADSGIGDSLVRSWPSFAA